MANSKNLINSFKPTHFMKQNHSEFVADAVLISMAIALMYSFLVVYTLFFLARA